MIRIFVLFVFLLDITFTDSACTNTLPLSAGTWKTSNRGTWTINSGQTSIANFEFRTSSTGSASTATMKCEDDSDTDGYIALKSLATFNLFGGDKNVYVCIKFEQQTVTNSDAYYFYLGSDRTIIDVGIYERIILLPTGLTFTFDFYCKNKSTAAERTHVAIKNGTEANAAITCPTSVQGTFSYSNTSCSSTFLDVCTTLTQFNFNYTVCAEAQMFSADGQFHCVYSGTSGDYNYLTVYNRDATTPDGSTYYQYSCLVYTTADTIVTTSINPKECFDSTLQTPTSTVHPDGVTRTYTKYGDSVCYDSSSSSTNLIWLYVLIVIIILIIIAIIIFLIWYIRRKRKREQQKVPDEESLQSSEDEEEQKKKDEEQKKADEEHKKKDEQQREASPVPAKEDDRTSIDSGIEQEKKEKKTHVKDKKVVIEDIKDKTEEDQRISDENSNDVTEQNENLVEQQTIDNNENNLEKLDTNNTSGNDKFEQDNDESENKNDHVTNFEQSENEQQDINKDEQIIISSNEQDNEQRENKSDDKNDDEANFERSEDEEQNINKDEKIIRNSNDQNQTDNLNEKVEENSHDNNDPNIDDKSLCNDESKKIIAIATDKNDEINVKDNDIITKNEDEQNNVSNTKIINKENNEKDKHDKIKSDKTIEQKEVGEDDNENKDDDLEAETKDDKQRRSVKIYEKSDWNGPLEHQEKHVDIGEKSTEQIPKIITVKEQEEEKEQEEDEEEGEKSGSEETSSSSRVTTPDPEEIERNIRKIGMKKSINFKPQGELSKVLVSRNMEEKSRNNQEMGKWKKMKSLFRVKTKKIKDVSQKKGHANELALDSDEEERQTAERENTVAPFMKEYNYKKQMEQQLDEQHVWGGEEDYTDRLKDSDDEDFADIFEVTTNEKGKEEIIEKTKIEEISDENKRSKYSKDSEEKEHLPNDEKSNKKQLTEDQAKDSGVDSPDLKKENTDIELKIDGDEEMGEVEMTEPPPGYIKDSSGRIIRLYDNKVMTEEEMQAIFPLAKLGVLFHVPRLKRTSHGRPTGDYIEDNFGPKLENDKRSIRNGEARDEHSKPKHPRSSRGSAARRETKDQLFQKSVAFEMDDGQSDILMIEDEDAMSIGQGSTEANRELLRKRLFRNKRKLRSRGDDKLFLSDEGRPRELSDLVRVIPQTGQKYLTNGRAAIPGAVVSRNDSLKNKFDPEQQQIYREGLAADKRILEQSPSLKRHPPGVPREAFVHQNPDDIRVSIDNLENEERLRRNQDGINIGSDDEFILVGNNREQQQEPLFTVRRPGQTTVRPVPGNHDRFCPKHDMRHALPWSLINQYHIRESSVLDANSVAKKQLAPKSADNGKREIDDRRLRELLEELYKDKKYFDHMIDTTERNTEPIIDERDLAEHGRDFLLERAEYWDERGEMMPRPPQTALGLRLSRMNTFVPDSGRVSNISYASTVTPQPPPEQLQHHNNVPHAFQKREHTIT